MAFERSASWNSPSITHLANCLSPSLPMNFSDEPEKMASQRHSELSTQAERIRTDYLNAEIDLGLAFTRLASAELDPASADQSRREAVRASTIVHRFVSLIANS